MSARETVTGSKTNVAIAAEPPDHRAADASSAALTQAVRAGLIAPSDVLQLQRMVGNHAVGQIAAASLSRPLQRASRSPEERAMADQAAGEGGKTDEPVVGPAGDRFVWDEFDGTLTVFMSDVGPYAGNAIQITYKEGTADELSKRNPADIVERAELLSSVRASALEFLRTAQGKYQESAGAVAGRVASAGVGKPTLCYKHTAAVANLLSHGTEKGMGGMDVRAPAIKGKRGGAFHTLESHPKGPRPGDIVSYGAVLPPKTKGGLRTANFFTILHIGVFKSRRTIGGKEVWTVVDGGQGTFENRQETRERKRTFTKEKLEVSIPKVISEGQVKIWDDPEEIVCGVLKSKVADAGQSADDKLLRGWLDIDEYFGGGSPPAETSKGAMNRVFVGKQKAAEYGAGS